MRSPRRSRSVAVGQIEQARCRRRSRAPVTSRARLRQAGPSRRATSRSCRSRTRRPARASSRARPTGRRRRPRPCAARGRRETRRADSRSPAAAPSAIYFASAASAAAMPASITARSITPTRIAPARQEFGEMHPALAADRFEPRKLGERIGVVVDAQVEIGPLLLAVDQQRGRLLAALVAARGLARLQRGDQPARERQRGVRRVGLRGLGDHRGTGQHVAGDREVLAGRVAAPVDAGLAGVRRDAARARSITCTWRWSRPSSAAVSVLHDLMRRTCRPAAAGCR